MYYFYILRCADNSLYCGQTYLSRAFQNFSRGHESGIPSQEITKGQKRNIR